MDWKKEEFLITKQNNGEMFREKVSGITTEIDGHKIGVHKGWTITDISTGCSIATSDTQKKAKEWVETNLEKIKGIFEKEGYKDLERKVKKIDEKN